MFPFLAPIKKPDHSERQGTIRFIEITFLADSPHVSRSNSAASTTRAVRTRENSGSSKSKGSSEGINLSRPSSRQKSKSPLASSQPSSARSAKSSPVPPLVSENPPPPSRHKNKGLETSQAMLELFGGGSNSDASPFGRKSPAIQSTPIGSRKNEATESAFSTFENRDIAHERALRKARGENQFSKEPKPGPEWFEGYERLDMTGIELPPDPNCPAEEILRKQSEEADADSDGSPSCVQKSCRMHESLPGPDLGDEEDEMAPDAQVGSTEGDDDAKVVPEDDPSISKRRASDDDNASVAWADGEGGDKDAEAAGGGSNTAAEDLAQKGVDGSGDGLMSLLIRGAQVVNDDSIFFSDVLIQDGVIVNVGSKIDVDADVQIIDAAGKMLLPAGIDVYTQFAAPESADDFQTGCKSALSGGTATVIEVVTPKTGESPLAAVNRVRQAADKALCNVALSVVIRQWSEAIKKEMEKLVADGVNSFIVEVEGDDKLYQLLEHSRSLGAHVRVLPENRTVVPLLEKKMLELGITGPEGFLQSRPEELESEKVNTICVLSQLTSCPISILAVSSAESLRRVEKARGSGAIAHAEISAAAIASDGTHYFDKCMKTASAHLTETPLRTEGTNKIIAALANQPFAVCTSGHKAISSEIRLGAKDFTSMPKGTTGAEERMFILWEKAVRSGRMDPMRFVAVTSSNAAKIFNMYPKKGRIAVGADADLVIWDANCKKKLGAAVSQSSVDVSVFEGITVHASVIATIVGGRVAWKDGDVKDAVGGVVALLPNSPFLFSIVSQREKFGWAEKVDREGSTPMSNGHKKSGDFDRDRNRKHLMESSIDFGGDRGANSKGRNPPGGRATGFW